MTAAWSLLCHPWHPRHLAVPGRRQPQDAAV